MDIDMVTSALGYFTTTNVAILLYSVVVPAAILWGRFNVKMRRQQIIKDLERTFGPQKPDEQAGREPIIPSFEFVKYKYQLVGDEGGTDAPLSWYALPVAIFVVICFLGFKLAFSPLDARPDAPPPALILHSFHSGHAAALGLPDRQLALRIFSEQGLVMVSFAFIGAYIFSLSYLIRSVANYDLSPLSFLRSSAHIVLACFVTLTLYSALPDLFSAAALGADPAGQARPLQTATDRAASSSTAGAGTSAAASPTPAAAALAGAGDGKTVREARDMLRPADCAVPAALAAGSSARTLCQVGVADRMETTSVLLIGLAFLIGFFPTLGIETLVSRFPMLQLKRVAQNSFAASRSMPLDIIDGIDTYTKFRLEEFGIADVQNLATANPIMLFVETPFGIYEVIDWVAQGQLVCAVGPTKVMELRKLNIRTIFDLEKFKYGSAESGAAEPVSIDGEFKRMVADILFDKRLAPDADKAPKAMQALSDMVTMIEDDLHVRRLRQIWQRIAKRLETEGAAA